MIIDENDENSGDEFPTDEDMDDQAKDNQTDDPTNKNDDNKKLGINTNDDGVQRSTISKLQGAP